MGAMVWIILFFYVFLKTITANSNYIYSTGIPYGFPLQSARKKKK